MIAIASDHGGYDLKERVKKYLEENNIPFRRYRLPQPSLPHARIPDNHNLPCCRIQNPEKEYYSPLNIF